MTIKLCCNGDYPGRPHSHDQSKHPACLKGCIVLRSTENGFLNDAGTKKWTVFHIPNKYSVTLPTGRDLVSALPQEARVYTKRIRNGHLTGRPVWNTPLDITLN